MAENSHTEVIDDFISSKGNKFSAELVMKDKKLEFKFPEANFKETDLKCPCCNKKNLKEQEKKYYCDCGFNLWKTIAGKTLSKEEIEQLCENKETEVLDGFTSKAGKEFSCKLVINKRKKEVKMDFGN